MQLKTPINSMFSRQILILISTSLQVGLHFNPGSLTLLYFSSRSFLSRLYLTRLIVSSLQLSTLTTSSAHGSPTGTRALFKPADHLTVDFVFYLVFNQFGQLVISLYSVSWSLLIYLLPTNSLYNNKLFSSYY